jgi:hypothetical protein
MLWITCGQVPFSTNAHVYKASLCANAPFNESGEGEEASGGLTAYRAGCEAEGGGT